MGTLYNSPGSSLAPDPTDALRILLSGFGTRQQRQDRELALKDRQAAIDRQKKQDQDISTALSDLFNVQQAQAASGGASSSASTTARTGALTRLAAVSPELARTMSQILEAGDEQQTAIVQQHVDEGVRLAAQLKAEPDFASRKRALAEIARSYTVDGKPLDRLVQLSNMPEGQLDTELDRMLLAGQEVKDLLGPAKPAKTREIKDGAKIRTEEWDPVSQTWKPIASAPRFNENEGDDRTNFVIDNDRQILLQKLKGTTPEELLKRTVKSTDTGFPNPDYDPQLTSQIRNALKKKKGDDPEFDRFQELFAGKQPTPATQPDPEPAPKEEQPEAAPEEEPKKQGEIPQAAIDHLRANPELAAQFDAKYGQGSSRRVFRRR